MGLGRAMMGLSLLLLGLSVVQGLSMLWGLCALFELRPGPA